VSESGIDVADGCVAGVGDLVVTRENNRLLTAGRGWVKNGDLWTVTATGEDGTMTLRRVGGAGEVAVPPAYVASHVELAYASTAHRAQGRTVATAHAMVAPTTTREALYVAATRGRESNWLYVDTAYDPDPQTGHDWTAPSQTAHEVLAGVLANQGAELAAHDQIAASHEAAQALPLLHAEYATLAQAAQQDRWEDMLTNAGLGQEQTVALRSSEAYGPLLAALRDAEGRGLDVRATLPALIASRTLESAHDVASVLHGRVEAWAERAGSRRRGTSNLIAGLIPRATGVTDPDMARALTERDQAIERRATTVAQAAVKKGAPWVRHLGAPPADPALHRAWMAQLRVVAAYRDRWTLNGPAPVDTPEQARTLEQLGHQRRAHAATQRAVALATLPRQQPGELTIGLPSVVVQHKAVER
jgi:hypothetical protein